MGFYRDQLVPRAVDLALGTKAMGRLRTRAMQGLSGTVVEIGFGSGTNVPYYPERVEHVLAVDPSAVGRKLARKRLQASAVPVEFVGLDGSNLPLEDESVDNALSTWTLCTIPDAKAALDEISRVLRPGGRLYFLEHGLSPDPGVARCQHRFNGVQKKIGGGCNLDRDIAGFVAGSGLDTSDLATFYMRGPRILSYIYSGTAIKR